MVFLKTKSYLNGISISPVAFSSISKCINPVQFKFKVFIVKYDVTIPCLKSSTVHGKLKARNQWPKFVDIREYSNIICSKIFDTKNVLSFMITFKSCIEYIYY